MFRNLFLRSLWSILKSEKRSIHDVRQVLYVALDNCAKADREAVECPCHPRIVNQDPKWSGSLPSDPANRVGHKPVCVGVAE